MAAFGPPVAAIVLDNSDAVDEGEVKGDWYARKRTYVDALATSPRRRCG